MKDQFKLNSRAFPESYFENPEIYKQRLSWLIDHAENEDLEDVKEILEKIRTLAEDVSLVHEKEEATKKDHTAHLEVESGCKKKLHV